LSEITDPEEVQSLIEACQRPMDVHKSPAAPPAMTTDAEPLRSKTGTSILAKHGPHLTGQDSPARSSEGNRRG
jgi:hypothetical protein